MSNNKKIKVTLQPSSIEHKKIEENLWMIENRLECNIKQSNEHLSYIIRPGFKTNYRSGPRWLDKLIAQIGDIDLSICWIIHDINYEGYLEKRLSADKLLYHMLKNTGVLLAKCQIIYIGLRVFGTFNYTSDSNNEFIDFKKTTKKIKNYQFDDVLNEMVSIEIPELELSFDNENQAEVTAKLLEIAQEENKKIKANEIEKFYDEPLQSNF